MGHLTRVDLETLLRVWKLDVTLSSARVERPAGAYGNVPTGLTALDWQLGGGLPRGQLSSITGPPSSGRSSLLCGLLAAVTCGDELAALVDTLDTFDPGSAAAVGIELSRLLWIRGRDPGEEVGMEQTLGRAVKALNLVLQAGGFGLVALDLSDVPLAAVRRLPRATWLRLARVVEGRRTACVVMGLGPIARSPAGVSIVLEPGGRPGRWSGTSHRSRMLRGLALRARLLQAPLRA